MVIATKTPMQYLKERVSPFEECLDINSLCRDYCKKKKVTSSEVFGHINSYWEQFTPVSGSVTDMVRIWYLAKMEILNGDEIEELLNWFFN